MYIYIYIYIYYICIYITGIELILAVEQKEYIPLIAPSAGVNVFIYDKKFAPELVQSDELILPVGHEINMGLSTVNSRKKM